MLFCFMACQCFFFDVPTYVQHVSVRMVMVVTWLFKNPSLPRPLEQRLSHFCGLNPLGKQWLKTSKQWVLESQGKCLIVFCQRSS